jgi:hypothetical protein
MHLTYSSNACYFHFSAVHVASLTTTTDNDIPHTVKRTTAILDLPVRRSFLHHHDLSALSLRQHVNLIPAINPHLRTTYFRFLVAFEKVSHGHFSLLYSDKAYVLISLSILRCYPLICHAKCYLVILSRSAFHLNYLSFSSPRKLLRLLSYHFPLHMESSALKHVFKQALK